MFLYINLSLFFVKFLEIMNKNLRFLFNYKGGQMKNKKIDKYIEEQSSKLTKGLIDRRQFMMSVLATGVTLPIALSLADKAVAATPKKGGQTHLEKPVFNTVEEAISQILMILSSPPLARYFPFGENANAYIPAVIPEKTLTFNEEKL